MDFHEKHKSKRERYEIITVHMKGKVETLAQLDEKIAPLVSGVWNGRTLPFPVIIDATEKTEEFYGRLTFPTVLLINPEGILIKVRGEVLKYLEERL